MDDAQQTGEQPVDRNAWREAVWAADRQALPPMSRLVAVALASFMDRSGAAWPSYDAIAARCGMPRSTMARHLRPLLSEGWLLVEPHGGPRSGRREHPNLYRAALPTPSYGRDGVHRPADGTESSGTPSHLSGTPSHSGADTVPPVGLELHEPQELHQSAREESDVYVESADRPDPMTMTSSLEGEDDLLDELRLRVEAAGKDSAKWTDHTVDRLRDAIWTKAETMSIDWRPVALSLAARGVERPLAYLANMARDDVIDAATPLPAAAPAKAARPPGRELEERRQRVLADPLGTAALTYAGRTLGSGATDVAVVNEARMLLADAEWCSEQTAARATAS